MESALLDDVQGNNDIFFYFTPLSRKWERAPSVLNWPDIQVG